MQVEFNVIIDREKLRENIKRTSELRWQDIFNIGELVFDCSQSSNPLKSKQLEGGMNVTYENRKQVKPSYVQSHCSPW